MAERPDLLIRPAGDDELEAFVRASEVSFAHHATKEDFDRVRLIYEADRTLAAMDGTAIVGTAASITQRLTVPGGEVDCAGVTVVGVHPSHRRRGVMSSLMRRQLNDLHERGEPVAMLWASEAPIYGRFGYGMAAFGVHLRVRRDRAALASPFGHGYGQVRIIDDRTAAIEAFTPIHERVRPTRPGMVDRAGRWWEFRLSDPDAHRDGFGPLFHALLEADGGAEGYVVYRFKHDWSSGGPDGTVEVVELVAATPEADAALWRFSLGIDLAGTVDAWNLPVDTPLLYLLSDPRAAKPRLHDTVWVRPIDAAALLSARRYPTEDRLRFGLRDTACAWNEGRYELEGGPDGATCRRVEAEPELELSVAELGAIVLGGIRPTALAQAGRIVERAPGALRRADLLFAWDRAPWCPHVF